jgi:hypothetical protein
VDYPRRPRIEKQYENFDFPLRILHPGMDEFRNSPARSRGHNTWMGMKINIFHKQDEHPLPESMGTIFPVIPPLKVNVRA